MHRTMLSSGSGLTRWRFFRSRVFATGAAALACICVSACSDGGTTEPDSDPARIFSVELTPGTATLTYIGETYQFSATATDSAGDTMPNVEFVWQSSNPSVATVDTTGMATAHGSGETVITATARGVPGNATVVVNQAIAGLEFRTQPSTAEAGSALSPAVQVEVRDSAGGVVEDAAIPITLELAGGAPIFGTTTVHAVHGVASFSGLRIERAEPSHVMIAMSPGISDATSDTFEIAPNDPVRLEFLATPPQETTAGQPLGVRVAITDQFSNTVTSATDPVTVQLDPNPAGGSLVGQTQTDAVDGVADFEALVIEIAGAGYGLAASSPEFDTIRSAEFVIRPAAPDHTAPVNPVSMGQAEQPLAALEIAVHDNFHNVVDTATPAISVALNSSDFPGGKLSGRLTESAVNGIAVFDSVVINKPGGHELAVTAPDLADTVQAVVVTLPALVTPMDAGGQHTCMPSSTGPFCWGLNDVGQLGNPQVTAIGDSVATAAASDIGFGVVSAGTLHTCGVSFNGNVYCWGSGADGRLGTGGTANEPSPAPIAATPDVPDTFIAISAGDRHTCAIGADRLAYCWGANDRGQLGIGSTGAGIDTPTLVADSIEFAWIAAGGNHTCGISAVDSLAYCWGANDQGQLGDGSGGVDSSSPVAVSGSARYVAIQAGKAHTCAVRSNFDLLVYCWGANDRGQLGNGNMPTESDVPVSVGVRIGLREGLFTSNVNGLLAVGAMHTCAFTDMAATGALQCWGANSHGQLGDPAIAGVDSDVPVAVDVSDIGPDPAPPLQWWWVTAGSGHTCAVEFDPDDASGAIIPGVSGVYCWGRNNSGQLGDGTTTNRDSPVRVVQGH